jgi:hypothetical protein
VDSFPLRWGGVSFRLLLLPLQLPTSVVLLLLLLLLWLRLLPMLLRPLLPPLVLLLHYTTQCVYNY